MRGCRECRECCIVMAINELQKPADEACPHLCAKGCDRYASRPLECRKFDCMWLTSILPAWMKPNKVHAVVWPADVQNEEGVAVQIVRVNFNAAFPMNSRVLRWAKRASQKFLVIIAYRDKFEAMLRGKQWPAGREGDTWRFDIQDGMVRDVTVNPAPCKDAHIFDLNDDACCDICGIPKRDVVDIEQHSEVRRLRAKLQEQDT